MGYNNFYRHGGQGGVKAAHAPTAPEWDGYGPAGEDAAIRAHRYGQRLADPAAAVSMYLMLTESRDLRLRVQAARERKFSQTA